MNILVGADPELFMKKGEDYISAYGMIEGDKVNPFPVRNGAVQVDGMALEFNIDPASTDEEFVHNVEDVLGQLRAMVPEFQVVAHPVAEFGSEYIAAQPEKARELGCDPDFNAWSGDENNPPNEELPFRTGSGHVHVGWGENMDVHDGGHVSMVRDLVKQLDFYLGLPSLLFDGDVKRRTMYGKAGAFRPKPYGCEYRTLSNKWLSDRKLMRLVFNNTQAAVKALLNGNTLTAKYGDIQEIINSSSVKDAEEICRQEGIVYAIR